MVQSWTASSILARTQAILLNSLASRRALKQHNRTLSFIQSQYSGLLLAISAARSWSFRLWLGASRRSAALGARAKRQRQDWPRTRGPAAPEGPRHCHCCRHHEKVSPGALCIPFTDWRGRASAPETKLNLRSCSRSSAASMTLSFPICKAGEVDPLPRGCHERMRQVTACL